MNESNPNDLVREMLGRMAPPSKTTYSNAFSDLAWEPEDDDVPAAHQRLTEATASRGFVLACAQSEVGHADLSAILWPGQTPLPEQLSFISTYAHSLRARAAESVPLIAVVGLLWDQPPTLWADDYAALKADLRNRGLTNGGWRVLSAAGAQLWRGAVGTKRFIDAPLDVVISLANGLAALNRDDFPPDEVVRLMADADGYLGLGQELRLYSAKLLRAVWERWGSGLQEHATERAGQEIIDVVDWWHRSARRGVDVPVGATWVWFYRSAAEWWEREELALRSANEPWPATLPTCRMGDFDIVSLSTPTVVWEEGKAMRHCLAHEQITVGLMDGTLMAFSIRQVGRKHPVATFTARRGDFLVDAAQSCERTVYLLEEIKAFANLDVTPEVRLLALQYLVEQQADMFARTFGPDNFKAGQGVLLARPDLPENVGLMGEICSLEPVRSTVENECGDCSVDWGRGYPQPANFAQMIPLARHGGQARDILQNDAGMGCIEGGDLAGLAHPGAIADGDKVARRGGPVDPGQAAVAEKIPAMTSGMLGECGVGPSSRMKSSISDTTAESIVVEEENDAGTEDDYEDGHGDNGDRCPICRHSLQEGQCKHLLLGLDGEEGAVSGLLYDDWTSFLSDIPRAVFNAVVGGKLETGCGIRIDELRVELASRFDWRCHMPEPEDVDDEPDPEDAYGAFQDAWLDAEGDAAVNKLLQEVLDDLPGVDTTYFEISTAPGLTWWGDNYWAADCEDTAAKFRERLSGRSQAS